MKTLYTVAVCLCLTTLVMGRAGAEPATSVLSISPANDSPIGSVAGDLALSLTPQNVTARVGDPVWVTAELRNTSVTPKDVFFEKNGVKYERWKIAPFDFTIVNQTADSVVLRQPGISAGSDYAVLDPTSISRLQGHMSVHVRVRLDSIYRFTEPGTYAVIATSWVSMTDWDPTTLQSNPIRITLLRSDRPESAKSERPRTFGVRLETDRPIYVVGEPIFVRITVENVTNRAFVARSIPPFVFCSLMILDALGDPLWPLGHGSARVLQSEHYPPGVARVLQYQDPADAESMREWASLESWRTLSTAFHIANPGIYTLLAFSGVGGYTASPPVSIRVINEDSAKVLRFKLHDPIISESVVALTTKYLALRERLATIARAASKAGSVIDPVTVGWPWWIDAQAFQADINWLPGSGDPTSPYAFVDANLSEAERHLAMAADAVISSCDPAKARQELKVANYFYDAVKRELAFGSAGPSDASDAPHAASAPVRCPQYGD